MQEAGVYLIRGLPNSTSCTQEQNQLYQEFKGKTRSKTSKIFSKKLADRSSMIKKYKNELTALGFHGNWNMITDLTQDECDNDEAILVLEDCVVTPDVQVVLDKLTKVMRSPSLLNDDLPQIVNGMKNEPIEMSPFLSTFTKDKIINCFRRVGYAPFTRECLSSPYIRHELGETHEDTGKDTGGLDQLVNDYEEAKLDLKKEGFNVEGIFDAEIPTATNLRRKETEDKQVNELIERNGGFSASAIYTNIGTVCINSGAVLKAQRYQLEKKATEEQAKK